MHTNHIHGLLLLLLEGFVWDDQHRFPRHNIQESLQALAVKSSKVQ
jgi:hypothetical protein